MLEKYRPTIKMDLPLLLRWRNSGFSDFSESKTLLTLVELPNSYTENIPKLENETFTK